MPPKTTARPTRRSGTGPEDERPGRRDVEHIVRRSADRRRELDRFAGLMRERGALAAVPAPPSLVELGRRRALEVPA